MTRRKTLKELTIKDNFMFGAVMCDEDNCRRMLELVLGFPIAHVKVSKEKSMIYHPEYKGIRLDVYASDDENTHYNVEMQAVRKTDLGKRSRYYHSQIDMELLTNGAEYPELPNTYVIFICDFDPFGEKKYKYTFQNMCMESSKIYLADGSQTIFLNTKGKNPEDLSSELLNFLRYVGADLEESTADFGDSYVAQLQETVSDIKQSRRMEERYMLTELLMQDERRAGRIEERVEQICKKLRKGKSLETVAEELEEDIESMRPLYELALKFAPDFDEHAVIELWTRTGLQ